ncbi:MAG: hypothetical protein FE835_14995 [Gammaproteobacteria bacterium]|nr:hypothetical protein [Gammaproteobacteria bacterium]
MNSEIAQFDFDRAAQTQPFARLDFHRSTGNLARYTRERIDTWRDGRGLIDKSVCFGRAFPAGKILTGSPCVIALATSSD